MTDEINNDDIEVDIDANLTDVENKIHEAERQLERTIVLNAIAENVEVNNAVSVYDVARANEVDNGVLDEAKDEEGNYQVAPALNALGKSSSGPQNPFVFILGLLIMAASIGFMLYDFLKTVRSNKKRNENIDRWEKKSRERSERLKRIAEAEINAPNTVGDDPECVDKFKKIQNKWEELVGSPITVDMVAFSKNPIGPWQVDNGTLKELERTIIWKKDCILVMGDLKKTLGIMTADMVAGLNFLDRYLDELCRQMKSGKPMSTAQSRIDISMHTKVTLPKEGKSFLYSSPDNFKKYMAGLFPDKYPDVSPGFNSKHVLDKNLMKNFSSISKLSIGFSIKAANTVADDCAKNIETISQKSKDISEKLKKAGEDAAVMLNELEGIDRGDYNVAIKKCNGEVSNIKKLLVELSKAITSSIKYANASMKVLEQFDIFYKYSEEYMVAVRKYTMNQIKKAGGNNSFAQSNQFVDNIQSAVREGSADEAVVNNIVAISEEEVSRLEAFVEELEANDGIDRSDVIQIEEAAPGLLSDVRQNYTFTFSRSKVGFDDTLATLRAEIERRSQINERLKSIH